MKKVLIALFLIGLFLTSTGAAFVLGTRFASVEVRQSSSPVCTLRATEIRTNPTGYILVRLASNTEVWVDRVEAPFAYVSYFDGKQWIEGTITASYIGLCGTGRANNG